MRLNMDFFKGNDDIKEAEQKVIDNYINQQETNCYENMLEQTSDLDVVYGLSSLRENIINWYEWKENATVLEVGANLGELTGYLCKNATKVVAIENSVYKSRAIARRYQNVENLEVFAGKLQDILLAEKFDYILLEESPNDLKYVKELLKPDGIILMIAENRFGITYFAGGKGKYPLFSSFCEEYDDSFSKFELEKLIHQEGYLHYKFYYPLPNAKLANVVFSDEYLPEIKNTKMSYNPLYLEESRVFFDELKALKQVAKNEAFEFFANAYLIEISNQEFYAKQPKFVSYNNNRKPEYRLMTKLYDTKVQKLSMTESSKNHIQRIGQNIQELRKRNFEILDFEQDEKINSEFVEGMKLDEIIVEYIQQKCPEKAIEMIQKWYCYIEERLEKTNQINETLEIQPEVAQKLTFVRHGYIDLVFENTFYLENKFVFFDQEWDIENIPLEYILYRAIHNLYVYHENLDKVITLDKFLEKFDIFKYKAIFDQLESYIQQMIMNPKMLEIVKKSYECVTNINDLNRQIDELQLQNSQKQERIQLLEQESAQKDVKMNKIQIQARVEDQKKADYIAVLENAQKQDNQEIEKLSDVNLQKDETINHLNEIIKVKEHEIEVYESMRAVKIAKKLRGLKNGLK